MAAVPTLSTVAHIQTEQVANIDSKDMMIELWKRLVHRVNQLLTSDHVDGIVITHGTDTLEETAYFLHLTVKNKKPVVLTAAMRPATALSADGPLNLLNAVVVAASKASFGQGVLVVMNGQIYTARDVTKTNTYSVDTFRSNEFGALGWVQGNQAQFQRSIANMHMNTTESQFNINKLSEMPSVEIVMSYAEPSRAAIDAFVAQGVKGIVIAGTGNGTIHASLQQAAIDAVKHGVAVLRSSRVSYGHMTHDAHDDEVDFLSAGTLNPWKARVLLMLILVEGVTNHAARQRIFDSY
jgi:L-asparaginase